MRTLWIHAVRKRATKPRLQNQSIRWEYISFLWLENDLNNISMKWSDMKILSVCTKMIVKFKWPLLSYQRRNFSDDLICCTDLWYTRSSTCGFKGLTSPGFLTRQNFKCTTRTARKVILVEVSTNCPGFSSVWLQRSKKKSRPFLTNQEGKKNLPTCEVRCSVSVLGVI